MIALKESAIIKLLVDDEGQLLANGSGNTLPVDRSYHRRSGINIQMKGLLLRQCHNAYLVYVPKLQTM